MKICIGIPTNRLIKPKTAQSVLDLISHSKYDYKIIVSERGFNTSENRNYIAAQAVNNNCDYLFFVDDDMILPPDTLDRLLAHNKDIIGGIYKTKYEVQADVCEYFDNERTGLFKVKALGTGCLLIKTEVFRKLPQPWFKYEWNQNGSIKRSHDWIFCEDARNAEYDVWADSTLEIKHIGKKEY
jgi:glycosyltransferase involved in cell wall biosynthesis